MLEQWNSINNVQQSEKRSISLTFEQVKTKVQSYYKQETAGEELDEQETLNRNIEFTARKAASLVADEVRSVLRAGTDPPTRGWSFNGENFSFASRFVNNNNGEYVNLN